MMTLTPQHQVILAHVANGLENGEIARKMNLAEATIATHMKNILRKAGARNRTQAVVKALNGKVLEFRDDGVVVPVKTSPAPQPAAPKPPPRRIIQLPPVRRW